ncbi:SDR family NAD(P)-dependent oxidoreductase [Microvirga flavescens]|uniref:SDR family NAD(P)-dependent oxidoreductase n=1 Tax=Microvirga flavescens TaxID=2249811 RepID=UPI000DD6EBB1|nr:SDR family NAD(P)-dependent oxidoreductase [Microvirga flavescens]
MARRIAIFGATSGIAAATARLWAKRGERLVLLARDAEALDRLARELAAKGAQVETTRADFADLSSLESAVSQAWNAFGGLDTAFVAYGFLPRQEETEKEPAALEEAILLNFTSPAVLANMLASRFEAQKAGMIAVITSVAGDRGRRSNYAYGAAKGGLQRFLEGLRHRLHRSRVRVLDIRPGFVSTRMTAHLPQAGALWATPEQVAPSIVSAIDRNRETLYTPRFWRAILLVARALPNAIFHRTPW